MADNAERKKFYVCFDIGGTAIKYALADGTGSFADRGEIATEAKLVKGSGIARKVCSVLKNYLDSGYEVAGAAISTAGIVDYENGSIIYAFEHILPEYSGLQWKALIESEFDIPCAVENDVNCAALGELWLGAGRGKSSLFAVTVGTSIGGCAVTDGRVIHGAGMSAGEIAYMRVPGGTLGSLATTTQLIADVAEIKGVSKDSIDGKKVFAWAKGGDADAVRCVKKLIEHLSDGIVNISAVLNPQCVVLGGGIMAQRDYLRPLLETAVREKIPREILDHMEVVFAKLGNDAGMLGALYNLLQRSGALR